MKSDISERGWAKGLTTSAGSDAAASLACGPAARIRRRGGGGGGRDPNGPLVTKQGLMLGALAAVGLWAFMSFYTVRPEERSVELFLGEFSSVGNPGLNFAPWPVITAEIVSVTGERTTDIGAVGDGAMGDGLMLTRDQNIVDIGFQVVWNVSDPAQYLFNLADPSDTMRAVSESAMRDIIARSELAPVLNRDRGLIASDLRAAVQGRERGGFKEWQGGVHGASRGSGVGSVGAVCCLVGGRGRVLTQAGWLLFYAINNLFIMLKKSKKSAGIASITMTANAGRTDLFATRC